jgi:hypothetical protein
MVPPKEAPMMVIALVIALSGIVGAFGYLANFAWTTRRDAMGPTAVGRSARLARRTAGVSVMRAH